MSDQLLVILRIFLLALVYLTFYRVARSMTAGLRSETAGIPAATAGVPHGSAAEPIPQAPAHARPSLVQIAPAARAGTRAVLSSETTIGRDGGCGIALEDPRVSKLHARVFRSGAAWMIDDLRSTNGPFVNGTLVDRARPLVPGDRLQVGDAWLEMQ